MYYSSYGAGYGGASGLVLVSYVLIPLALLLGFWAQMQVSGNFKKYSRIRSRRGITGAQAAQEVLRANGVYGVGISRCSGSLTDHYDPRNNCIYLSEPVYDATTIAAVGVACHEAGHAVQYAENYFPIQIRSAVIPLTNIGSRFFLGAFLLGMILNIEGLALLGVILFGFTTFFQLITLPVEFDASMRAVRTIEDAGILYEDEIGGAKKVLRAAALTYVAALLMSALQLLRYALIFMGRYGNRRRD